MILDFLLSTLVKPEKHMLALTLMGGQPANQLERKFLSYACLVKGEKHMLALTLMGEDPDNRLERRLLTYASPDPRQNPYFDASLDPFCTRYLAAKDLRASAKQVTASYMMKNNFNKEALDDLVVGFSRMARPDYNGDKSKNPPSKVAAAAPNEFSTPAYIRLKTLQYRLTPSEQSRMFQSLDRIHHTLYGNLSPEDDMLELFHKSKILFLEVFNEFNPIGYKSGNAQIASLFNQAIETDVFIRQSDYANAIHHYALAGENPSAIRLFTRFKELFPWVPAVDFLQIRFDVFAKLDKNTQSILYDYVGS